MNPEDTPCRVTLDTNEYYSRMKDAPDTEYQREVMFDQDPRESIDELAQLINRDDSDCPNERLADFLKDVVVPILEERMPDGKFQPAYKRLREMYRLIGIDE